MNEENFELNNLGSANRNNNSSTSTPPFKGEGTGERLVNYEKSLAELETIARKMESGQYDIDELTTQLKKAQELIKLCKDKLTKTDAEIKKVLDNEEK